MGVGAFRHKRKINPTKKETKKREPEKKKEEEEEDSKIIEQKEDKKKINLYPSENKESLNESLISYKNRDEQNEQNIEIDNFENKDQNNDSQLMKNVVDEKDTNIFIAFHVSYIQYRNSIVFNLYFGPNNIIEPIFMKKINNEMVFFYHIQIKEEDITEKNQIEGKKKIFLEVDSFHSYSTTIKYLYYHINFLYDMEWKASGNNRDEKEMPQIDINWRYFGKFLFIFK